MRLPPSLSSSGGSSGGSRTPSRHLRKSPLSTVQRVERGEAVRPAQLRKLAVALKRAPDAFTREVTPLTPTVALEALRRDAAWMNGRVRVKVAPLRKEAQVRELAQTELFVADSDVGDEAAGAISELREWFDLASFIRMEHSGAIQTASSNKAPLREFYRSLLESVRRIEAEHRAVCLAGTYKASTTGVLGRVAVIALRSRDNSPAAATIKTLWAEGSIDPRDIAWGRQRVNPLTGSAGSEARSSLLFPS